MSQAHRHPAMPLMCAAAALLFPQFGGALVAQDVVNLPARDAALSLDFSPSYSIGGIDGPDWQLFGAGVRVAFADDGRLRVMDGTNFRILAVDEVGALAWEAGRQGGGPGEFGYPMAMAAGADGVTTVFDVGNQSFVQFDADGSYIDQYPSDPSGGMPGREMMADPMGGIVYSSAGVVAVRREAGGAEVDTGPGSTESIRRVLAGNRSGVVYDAWRLPPTRTEESAPSAGFRMQMPVMRAFEPDLFYAPLASGGMVVADSVDYAIKVLDENGTIERVLRRSIEPRDVGRAEREAEKKRQLEDLQSGGGPRAVMLVGGGSGGGRSVQSPAQDQMRAMMEGRIESMVFAEQVPVIETMRVDPWSGRIWVRRAAPRIGDDGPIDVLTAEGDYLGTLSADQRIPAAFGPDGWVAYVEVDELDVTTVQVGRVTGLR